MRTASLLEEGPTLPVLISIPTPPDKARRGRLGTPVLAMVSGAVLLLVAAGLGLDRQGSAPPGTPSPSPAAAVDSSAITVSARDISVVTQVYGAGEDSGWHTHSGIHAVTVLSGVLTVYDAQCRPQTFGPGRPYVGGQELHLVRNETAGPVEMAVTYLSPSHGGRPTQRLPAPAGCAS